MFFLTLFKILSALSSNRVDQSSCEIASIQDGTINFFRYGGGSFSGVPIRMTNQMMPTTLKCHKFDVSE